MVGITTAITSLRAGSGNIGIGFAIPIDHAVKIANQLLATAELSRKP